MNHTSDDEIFSRNLTCYLFNLFHYHRRSNVYTVSDDCNKYV